jgi:hypothetical protein
MEIKGQVVSEIGADGADATASSVDVTQPEDPGRLVDPAKCGRPSVALSPHDMTPQPTDADYRHLLEFRTGLRRFLRWSEDQANAQDLTAAQHQLLLAIKGHPSHTYLANTRRPTTHARSDPRMSAETAAHRPEGATHPHPPHGTIEQPVQPEIPRSRFARGMLEREPADEEVRLGRYADGQQTLPPAGALHRGRFSQGQEMTGDGDPEKHIRRRYSEGLETHHPGIAD